MWRRKVLWSEGQFLRPQHFQQQDRYVENLIDRRARAVRSYGWGFESLALDDNALGVGKFALGSAQGILPDGSVFAFPGDDEGPQPLVIPVDVNAQLVYLVTVAERQGVAAATLNDRDSEQADIRFGCVTTDLADVNVGFDEPAPVQLGCLRLQLVLHENLGGQHAAMPVARLLEKRADGRVMLDTAFVAPALSVTNSANLRAYLRELLGLLKQRSDALATRMNHPGRGGVSEVADFLFLKTVNGSAAVFEHLDNVPMLHPESLYRTCVGLAGDLATFGTDRRLVESFRAYDHDDLELTFQPVMNALRAALSMVIEQSAISIELQNRGYGVRVAVVGDRSLFKSASFVLAVSAQMPGDTLRQRFPNQVKIGPVEKIRDLVNLQLPGVGVRAMPVAPRQIPYNAGFNYFELDQGHEMWSALNASGGLAMHLPDEFPGLQMEFWAIRS